MSNGGTPPPTDNSDDPADLPTHNTGLSPVALLTIAGLAIAAVTAAIVISGLVSGDDEQPVYDTLPNCADTGSSTPWGACDDPEDAFLTDVRLVRGPGDGTLWGPDEEFQHISDERLLIQGRTQCLLTPGTDDSIPTRVAVAAEEHMCNPADEFNEQMDEIEEQIGD